MSDKTNFIFYLVFCADFVNIFFEVVFADYILGPIPEFTFVIKIHAENIVFQLFESATIRLKI